jgi:hypothetical protein
MPCRTILKSACFALAVAIVWAHIGLAETTVTLLTGETRTVAINAITAQGEIILGGDAGSLELADVRRIERTVQPPPHTDAATFNVLLAGGGEVFATSVQLQDEAVRIVTPCAEVRGTIDLLRSIRFSSGKPNVEYETACKNPPENNDLIFVRVDDKVQALRGFVLTIDDQSLAYEWAGEKHQVSRDNLVGVVFVALGVDAPDVDGSVVHLSDGSIVGAVSISLEGELRVRLPDNSMSELPWQFVSRVDIRSPRLTFVSDLDPVESHQRPIVTLPQPYRRDKSVSGGPLKLGARTYEKGLGVRSYSRLRYDIKGEYEMFVATIGIDAGTDGKGDCEFVVLGDGTELLRLRVRGSDSAKQIAIDIANVDALTLVVEPGEALDLADHGNWCDAVLMRRAKP